MISVHVDVQTRKASATCTLCPSWHPEFDDEVKAWEIASRHGEVAHGEPRQDTPPPSRYADVVLVARVGLLDTPDFVERIGWLTETLGDLMHQGTSSQRVRDQIGMTFSHHVSFAKELPADRLDYSLSDTEIEHLTDNWRSPE